MIATSVAGKQTRITLGRWPLISVEQAREIATPILKACREGQAPPKATPRALPTLREVLPEYAKAKGLKASSLIRYESMLRTHFKTWFDASVLTLDSREFKEHCQAFASTRGNSIVEVGRGIIGSIVKYLNAVHGLSLISPFDALAAAGLLPERAKPRNRKLQEEDLHLWHQSICKLPEMQRDYLMLIAMTGLRKEECKNIQVNRIDFDEMVLHILDTKNGDAHSLPITQPMNNILSRRSKGLKDTDYIFEGMSSEHIAEMAQRAGAPDFMLHDLRKMLATKGSQLGYGDAVMRRILNHRAKRSDTLHRHYISLGVRDIQEPLHSIQEALLSRMREDSQGCSQRLPASNVT